MDFGANKTLTGGLALQTSETYKEFIGASDISFGGNNFEVYFEEDDFDKFADRLKESFPDAKIFCVIREQKDMILSTYFQYLEIGGTDSLKQYLTRRYDQRRPGFSPDQFKYLDLVSYYYKLFSSKRVLVLPYELFREDPDDFFTRLGSFASADIRVEAPRKSCYPPPR